MVSGQKETHQGRREEKRKEERTNLDRRALVTEGRVEEGGDQVHDGDGGVVLEDVGSLVGREDTIDVQQEVFKQLPDVVRDVDFLHLNFCVNETMVQEVDVGVLDFRDAVGVRDDADDVVE